jgi:hypothetical protein
MNLFVGPSFPSRSALEILGPDVRIHSPVKRDDLYRAFEKGERIFLLVDGEFEQNLAVSCGEVLDVIRSGGLVMGSSSMGAMRAAELENFGMAGYGRIFDIVKGAHVFRDDWLGHLYDTSTLKMMTLPYIELLFILEPLSQTPLIEFGRDLQDSKKIRFDALTPEKCTSLIEAIAGRRASPYKKRLQEIWSERRLSQKQRDASLMTRKCRARLVEAAQINAKIGGRHERNSK